MRRLHGFDFLDFPELLREARGQHLGISDRFELWRRLSLARELPENGDAPG
jgi:hypothetical protein